MIAAIDLECAREAFGRWAMVASLTGLAALALMPAVARVARTLRVVRRDGLALLLAAPLVVALAYHGMTKGKITYPVTDIEQTYLWDAGSKLSNDCVVVRWTRSAIVPDSAWLWVDCCQEGWTNAADVAAHTVSVYSNRFSAVTSPLVVAYANATNYNWYVYTDWTPGPTVHTNGVAQVTWQQSADGSWHKVVPVRTGIYLDATRAAPPPGITNAAPATAGN